MVPPGHHLQRPPLPPRPLPVSPGSVPSAKASPLELPVQQASHHRSRQPLVQQEHQLRPLPLPRQPLPASLESVPSAKAWPPAAGLLGLAGPRTIEADLSRRQVDPRLFRLLPRPVWLASFPRATVLRPLLPLSLFRWRAIQERWTNPIPPTRRLPPLWTGAFSPWAITAWRQPLQPEQSGLLYLVSLARGSRLPDPVDSHRAVGTMRPNPECHLVEQTSWH